MKLSKINFIIILSIVFSFHTSAQEETLSFENTVKFDIPYLEDNEPLQELDIYFPVENNNLFPVLVHIHGGGWTLGDKKNMKDTGLFYASQGVLFITPNYRLSPQIKHPTHIQDCAAAISWVFNNIDELGGDKNRIFLSGHSAGAHLAALLGTNSEYLQKYNIEPNQLAGIIPVDSGNFNLLNDNNETLVRQVVKQAFGNNKESLKEASPFYNITNNNIYPEFLILNTTTRVSSAMEGKEFAAKLKKAGCAVQFIPVDNHTHKEMAEGMYDESDPVGKAILKFILNKTEIE